MSYPSPQTEEYKKTVPTTGTVASVVPPKLALHRVYITKASHLQDEMLATSM